MQRHSAIAGLFCTLLTLAPAGQAAPLVEAYVPGLGEMMGAIQLRHAKLWFAGTARNWPLAAYELGEIKEALEDAARLQPDFKGKPVAAMIETTALVPMGAVEKAIAQANEDHFKQAFDGLTGACNKCHQSLGFGFIVIKRPTLVPLTNQRFEH